ncbi:MAG: flagellar hook-basal body protein [Verrucomicrobia bacterium]|nr:flagellar hook-basal body protein [Verrucomicrobiota bacterium]
MSMNIGLHTGANHLAILENWQAMISNNLANASTPGFQKSAFEISLSVPESSGAADPNQLIPQLVGRTQRVFSDGQVRITGNPLDLAIQGGGFFALNGENGERMFTKDGEFHLNGEGMLVNKAGYPVQADGDVLTIDLQEGPITITRDGSVNQKGQDVGRLSIYDFANPEALDQGNGSYFFDRDGLAGVAEVEFPIVNQGQLMGSSVASLTEMVSMIQVSRAYEITQKLIQESDERAGKAIQTFSV